MAHGVGANTTTLGSGTEWRKRRKAGESHWEANTLDVLEDLGDLYCINVERPAENRNRTPLRGIATLRFREC